MEYCTAIIGGENVVLFAIVGDLIGLVGKRVQIIPDGSDEVTETVIEMDRYHSFPFYRTGRGEKERILKPKDEVRVLS